MMGGATGAEYASRIPISTASPSKHGIVFASIGTQVSSPFRVAWVEIRPKGQGGTSRADDLNFRPHINWASFAYDADQLDAEHGRHVVQPAAYQGVGDKGTVNAVALTPGDYEVHQFAWNHSKRYGETNPHIAATFHVDAGEAVYLGRFVARSGTAKDQRKRSIITAHYEVRDAFEEDSALLTQSKAIPLGFKLRNANLPTCRPPVRFARCDRDTALNFPRRQGGCDAI